jgi:hypothetical protein
MNATTKNWSLHTSPVPAGTFPPSRVLTLMHSFRQNFCAHVTSSSLLTFLGTSFRWDVRSLRMILTPTRSLQTNHGSWTCLQRLSFPTHSPPMTTHHCWERAVHVFTPAHSPSIQIPTGLTPMPVRHSQLFLDCILPPLFLWELHCSVSWRPLPPHNQQDLKPGGRHGVNKPGLQCYGGSLAYFSSNASVFSSMMGLVIPASSDLSSSGSNPPPAGPSAPSSAPAPLPAPPPPPPPIAFIKDKPSDMGLKNILDKDSWIEAKKVIDAHLCCSIYWLEPTKELVTMTENA